MLTNLHFTYTCLHKTTPTSCACYFYCIATAARSIFNLAYCITTYFPYYFPFCVLFILYINFSVYISICTFSIVCIICLECKIAFGCTGQ